MSGFLENIFTMLKVEYPEHTVEHLKKIAQNTTESLFTFDQFYDEYEDIFSGEIYQQIEQYDLLCFNIGATLRRADTKDGKKLDTSG